MERGKHPGFQIDVAVVTSNKTSFSAAVTDISAGVIVLKSTRRILPGDQISVFIKLPDEIQLLGTVIWTLDFSQNGEIMYHVGVQTDVIISPNKKTPEFSDRAKAVEEILYEVDTHGLTAIALN